MGAMKKTHPYIAKMAHRRLRRDLGDRRGVVLSKTLRPHGSVRSVSRTSLSSQPVIVEDLSLCGLDGCTRPAWHVGICSARADLGVRRRDPEQANSARKAARGSMRTRLDDLESQA